MDELVPGNQFGLVFIKEVVQENTKLWEKWLNKDCRYQKEAFKSEEVKQDCGFGQKFLFTVAQVSSKTCRNQNHVCWKDCGGFRSQLLLETEPILLSVYLRRAQSSPLGQPPWRQCPNHTAPCSPEQSGGISGRLYCRSGWPSANSVHLLSSTLSALQRDNQPHLFACRGGEL